VLVAGGKVLPSNRCYAIQIYNGTKSENVQSVILDICAEFHAFITDFCTNRPDCRYI